MKRGSISFELIFGIFILSLSAITISFLATTRLWEKRHIEAEIFNLQKIFYDLKRAPTDIANQNIALPSGITMGLYNENKELIKGMDILPPPKKIPAKLEIVYDRDYFFPSVTIYDIIPTINGNFILVLRKDFDIEKTFFKKIILYFSPFALICLITLTGFSYIIYNKRIIKPLKILKNAYENIDNPTTDTKLTKIGIAEWDNLFMKFNEMMERIKSYEKNLQNKIEELKEANKLIKSAQDEIIFSEKMATVGRLSAGLAHEIGNPITSIMGYLSFLIEETKDEKTKEILTVILKETERINKIIRDLLNFARMEKKEVAFESVNPVEIIEETIKLLIPQKDFSKIHLVKDYNCYLNVIFSKEELKQVILNLLLNAIDVTPPEGKIIIGTYKNGDDFEIKIEDEGGGIPKDIKDKIFEPFFTTKPTGKGTGLGLSVVLTLLERYNGKISHENKENGSIFIVKLKIAEKENV